MQVRAMASLMDTGLNSLPPQNQCILTAPIILFKADKLYDL